MLFSLFDSSFQKMQQSPSLKGCLGDSYRPNFPYGKYLARVLDSKYLPA
jgi:hypothetical protein